ncbi:MAG: PQQ-binding-like beta-propeller repeat protein [Planctomycetaceae bacterium]|jgi:hypothetical protein|nr:PQQ-binding-like beta-propeller repeat protein [Planctomycetaceae bacterium]
MTKTARRRWSQEFEAEVDGIAIAAHGPVLVHLYEQPAGDRWIDDAIPGKLASLDRTTGEPKWTSPCEVGYGRGFGAGFGRKNDAVVLGPSTQGNRIVRMSLDTGELVGAAKLPVFDSAIVGSDLCVVGGLDRIAAYDSETLKELWRYQRDGERYHGVARAGERVFVVYSVKATKKRGVLALDAKKGRFEAVVVAPKQPALHDLCADAGALIAMVDDLESALPQEALLKLLSTASDEDLGKRGPALLTLKPGSVDGDAPLWFEKVALSDPDEVGELAIGADSGKLYIVRGALVEVRDALTGRPLGEWAVPGLDERVGWQVSQGALLLAEEERVSIFELPA